MAKKLSKREKWLKEQTKLFEKVTKTMRLKIAIKQYGLAKVVWAMNRFVHKQQELKSLCRKQDELQNELADIKKQIG